MCTCTCTFTYYSTTIWWSVLLVMINIVLMKVIAKSSVITQSFTFIFSKLPINCLTWEFAENKLSWYLVLFVPRPIFGNVTVLTVSDCFLTGKNFLKSCQREVARQSANKSSNLNIHIQYIVCPYPLIWPTEVYVKRAHQLKLCPFEAKHQNGECLLLLV